MVTATLANTGPTGYFTVRDAFNAINAGIHQGAITVTINCDTNETPTSAILNPGNVLPAAWTTLLMVPVGTRTVTGAMPAGTPLIDLNGADNVTIDGLPTAADSLTMTNTTVSATAGTSTIRFREGATFNLVDRCTVRGSSTMAAGTAGGTILFSTSTIAGGNSNNTISRSNIAPAGTNLPTKGVHSLGTAANPNSTNTVSSCNVFDYTSTGVLVSATGAGNGWTVNPSSFYQTTPRTAALTGISIQGGSGHSILNNSIGGTAPLAGGTNLVTSSTFRGIDLTVGTASATSVQGNTIKNIRSTLAGSFTSSYGIFLQAGMANIGNVTGNTVGSALVAERYEISGDSYGIRVVSTSTVNLSNNTVNNFGTAPGVPTGEFYFGISVEGTAGTHTVFNNTVTNVTNGSTPDTSFNTQTIGMIVSATGVQSVRQNRITAVRSTRPRGPNDPQQPYLGFDHVRQRGWNGNGAQLHRGSHWGEHSDRSAC